MTQVSSVAPATPATPTTDRARLQQVAQQFEAVFLRQMIGSMRQAGLGDDLLGGDAEKQFRDMQDARLADDLSKTGSFGIAELLVNQLGAKVAGGATVTPAEGAVAAAEQASLGDKAAR